MSSLVRQLNYKRQPTSNKIVTLVDRVNLIQRKFDYHVMVHMMRTYIEFAYKLATDKATKGANGDYGVTIIEQFTICFEYIHSPQIFWIGTTSVSIDIVLLV